MKGSSGSHQGENDHPVILMSFFCKVSVLLYRQWTDTLLTLPWYQRVRAFECQPHLSLLLTGPPLGGPVSFLPL